MTAGVTTYMGLAVPLFGESTITQKTAATDILSIQQAAAVASTTGNMLALLNSAGTFLSGFTKQAHLMVRTYTTRPTTLLTKGELFILFHNSTPKIGICSSTAANTIKLIRLKTKTFGRLTA